MPPAKTVICPIAVAVPNGNRATFTAHFSSDDKSGGGVVYFLPSIKVIECLPIINKK